MIKKIIFEFYEIDELGNIYSHKSKKYLKSFLDRYGYLYVRIKNKHRKVHRLVALNFLDNKENKPCVDHIDRNKLNNHYSNLRFVTPKENSNNINTIQHLKKIGERYKIEYGKRIADKKGNVYVSIIEASRQVEIPRSTIQWHLKKNTGEWFYKQ